MIQVGFVSHHPELQEFCNSLFGAVLGVSSCCADVTATAENINAGFAYSDNNPVKLTFTLAAQ